MSEVDKEKICDCKTFRHLFEMEESGDSLSREKTDLMSEHESNCKACAGLRKQHRQIIEMAANFPQFDISEGLTQRILESLDKESSPGLRTSFLPIGIATTVAVVMLVPFDSVQSLLGWGAGLLGLVSLEVLMKTANTREQLI